MLKCKQLVNQSSEYLDGNLSAVQKLNFRLHLFMCKHCRNYVSHLRTTVFLCSRYGRKLLNKTDAKAIASECESVHRSDDEGSPEVKID